MEYDQRMIIKFLWNKGIDVHKSKHRFQTQFDEHIYKLRTIWFWIIEVRLGRQDFHDEIRTGWSSLDDLDAKIIIILNKSLIKSTRSIAETLHIAHQTVFRHLYNSIGFKSFHLHWVSHLLTDNLCEEQKEDARAMLPFLHIAERDRWHHFVTGDDSWFFLNTSPRRMWTLSRDDVATKSRKQIKSKKFMFTIIWNPTEFYVVDRLPNDTKMNIDYFVTNILISIEQMIFPWRRASHEKNWWFLSTIALFTQVGVQQIGSKNMAFTACQTNTIHLIWLSMTCTCFLQS
jgi:hypothetical protein